MVVAVDVKLFGDTTPIDWSALNVRMPFAPMHKLAEKYKKELISPELGIARWCYKKEELEQTFETKIGNTITDIVAYQQLPDRINYRVHNTIAALQQCTANTICVNLGGGMHHAEKYPNTGYAYSLINDIIWAVDYQLEQGKTIGIIDLDFHFGGGTYEYYQRNEQVRLYDQHHPKGELQKHIPWAHLGNRQTSLTTFPIWGRIDKVLLNIGTDWYKNDVLFGQYGQMEAEDLLNVWKETITQITAKNIPLCITMGGGYGNAGLELYESLISWLRSL